MIPKPTILVIDDDQEIEFLVNMILSSAGYEVSFATSWEEAENLLLRQQYNYNLILLDLMLPGVNGSEAYVRLRKVPKTADIPIIIVSAINNIDKRVELLSLGANDYIVKPFTSHELLTRITVHLKISQLDLAKRTVETQLAAQNRYLEAINYIGHGAIQYLDLESMLNQVIKLLAQHFDSQSVAIYLYHPDTEELKLADSLNYEHSEVLPPIVLQVVEQQQTTIKGKETAVPLLRDDVCLGVLLLHSHYIPTEGVRALEILTTHLTTAITNTYLFEDVQRHNRQLESIAADNARLLQIEQQQRRQAEELQQMSQIISSSLEMKDVLNAAMDNLRIMLEVDTGSIVLLDEKTNQLSFASSLQTFPQMEQTHLRASEGIVGYVVRYGVPLIVNDAQNHPQFFPTVDHYTGYTTRSILCVPLIARDRVIGAIELLNKIDGNFSEMDLTLVNSAATAIAIAIDNARLYREQAELIKELQNSQAQLVQSEKLGATGRLAASLAHEINNPLQAIHSCLQLAVYFDLSEEKQSEYLHMASEEVERLIDIVTRILDFARPSSGAHQMININKIISQVLQLSGKHIAHHNWEVRQILASDIPAIPLIPDQIAQVFLSVILNAFDAMPEGGRLTISTRVRPEWVDAMFEDNGEGMSADLQAKIFEPFYTTKESRPGLGLAISYGIIEQHGGRIDVQSEIGKGSIFTISLPRHIKLEMK